jgi:hypothetical protein
MPLSPRHAQYLSLSLVGALAGNLQAGPGLLVRNAERYYKAPISRTLHREERLPSSPPVEMLRAFQEEDLFALQGASYLTGYQGPSWDRSTPCTRYQAAFLLGGFLQELSDRYGELLKIRRTGPRRLLLPREKWGQERVALTLALPLLRPRSIPWWDDSPDRFQVAGWLTQILERLKPRVLFLTDPRPYQQAGRHGDLPVWGHPMRRRARRVLETHLMAAPEGFFRGRERLTAREWVRILARLRVIVNGYRLETVGGQQVDASAIQR